MSDFILKVPLELIQKIRNIKALILDMDGIIVDTEPIHINSFRVLIDELGFNYTEDFLNSLVGFSVENNIETILKKNNHFSENAKQNSVKKRESIYLDLLTSSSIKPIDGVYNIIKICKRKNLKLALASSSSNEQVSTILKLTELDYAIDIIVNGDEVRKKKPAPDIYLKAIKRLNFQPNDCLAVEDSPAGILSAKSAGLKCIGVINQYSDKLALQKADWLLDSMNKLSEII